MVLNYQSKSITRKVVEKINYSIAIITIDYLTTELYLSSSSTTQPGNNGTNNLVNYGGNVPKHSLFGNLLRLGSKIGLIDVSNLLYKTLSHRLELSTEIKHSIEDKLEILDTDREINHDKYHEISNGLSKMRGKLGSLKSEYNNLKNSKNNVNGSNSNTNPQQLQLSKEKKLLTLENDISRHEFKIMDAEYELELVDGKIKICETHTEIMKGELKHIRVMRRDLSHHLNSL